MEKEKQFHKIEMHHSDFFFHYQIIYKKNKKKRKKSLEEIFIFENFKFLNFKNVCRKECDNWSEKFYAENILIKIKLKYIEAMHTQSWQTEEIFQINKKLTLAWPTKTTQGMFLLIFNKY